MSTNNPLQDKCEELGGEMKDFQGEDKKACVIEDDGIALTTKGEIMQID